MTRYTCVLSPDLISAAAAAEAAEAAEQQQHQHQQEEEKEQQQQQQVTTSTSLTRRSISISKSRGGISISSSSIRRGGSEKRQRHETPIIAGDISMSFLSFVNVTCTFSGEEKRSHFKSPRAHLQASAGEKVEQSKVKALYTSTFDKIIPIQPLIRRIVLDRFHVLLFSSVSEETPFFFYATQSHSPDSPYSQSSVSSSSSPSPSPSSSSSTFKQVCSPVPLFNKQYDVLLSSCASVTVPSVDSCRCWWWQEKQVLLNHKQQQQQRQERRGQITSEGLLRSLPQITLNFSHKSYRSAVCATPVTSAVVTWSSVPNKHSKSETLCHGDKEKSSGGAIFAEMKVMLDHLVTPDHLYRRGGEGGIGDESHSPAIHVASPGVIDQMQVSESLIDSSSPSDTWSVQSMLLPVTHDDYETILSSFHETAGNLTTSSIMSFNSISMSSGSSSDLVSSDFKSLESSSWPSASYLLSSSEGDVSTISFEWNLFTISVSIILTLLILTTIIGNIFVIIAILVERNLQTFGNYLVFSLAIADLMVAGLVMPIAAIYEVTGQWIFNSTLCDFWTCIDVLSCTASILHLVAIALDRYWAVTNIDYIHSRSSKSIGLLICAVWTVAVIISAAPILGWKDTDYFKRIEIEKKCLISQDVAYQVLATCATFYAPLIVILILYWKIFKVIQSIFMYFPLLSLTFHFLALPRVSRLSGWLFNIQWPDSPGH